MFHSANQFLWILAMQTFLDSQATYVTSKLWFIIVNFRRDLHYLAFNALVDFSAVYLNYQVRSDILETFFLYICSSSSFATDVDVLLKMYFLEPDLGNVTQCVNFFFNLQDKNLLFGRFLSEIYPNFNILKKLWNWMSSDARWLWQELATDFYLHFSWSNMRLLFLEGGCNLFRGEIKLFTQSLFLDEHGEKLQTLTWGSKTGENATSVADVQMGSFWQCSSVHMSRKGSLRQDYTNYVLD